MALPLWDVASGATVIVVLAALAVLVLRAAPREHANRALAAWLAIFVAWWILVVFLRSASNVWLAYNATAYTLMLAWQFAPVYLVFVSEAIRSTWTRPLRTPAARILLAAFGLIAPVTMFANPSFWITVDQTGESFDIDAGPVLPFFGGIHVLTFSFTLFVALHAWLRSPPGSVSRARVGSYAFAFGTFDASIVALQIGLVVPALAILDPVVYHPLYLDTVFLVFGLLLARAMLKYQLFDFELKLKWTLNRGTVAAIFVAAFFAVSEIVSGLLSERIGLVAGVLATALLVFALAPLQRFAERVSDAAMPHVKDTEEYRVVRKREVYRAAVDSAIQDGEITIKERDVLATLADELGLTVKDVTDIERQAARDALPRKRDAPPEAT